MNEIKEIRLCKPDPWYFIKTYIYTLDSRKGKLQFPNWDFLQEFIHILDIENKIVCNKSRQMMVTWSCLAYILHQAIFRQGTFAILTSRREAEMHELVARTRFMYNNLPSFLKPTCGTNNKSEIQFPRRNSRILGLPSVENGLRSYNPSIVLMDEAAFITYADSFYVSAKPALGDEGKFIIVSTPDLPKGLFYQIVNDVDIAEGDNNETDRLLGLEDVEIDCSA